VVRGPYSCTGVRCSFSVLSSLADDAKHESTDVEKDAELFYGRYRDLTIGRRRIRWDQFSGDDSRASHQADGGENNPKRKS
jgi:hypothetical protein